MARIELIADSVALDHALSAATAGAVFVFKHSLICPLSSSALHEYEEFVESRQADAGVRFGLIEIQKARPLSDAVEERTGVRHESPQALLLYGGRVVWSASHHGITRRSLELALEQMAS